MTHQVLTDESVSETNSNEKGGNDALHEHDETNRQYRLQCEGHDCRRRSRRNGRMDPSHDPKRTACFCPRSWYNECTANVLSAA